MRRAIRNIFRDNYREVGKWAYLYAIIAIPVYGIAKLFGVHNKNYERENYP